MKWHNWSRANPNFQSTKLATISFGNGSKTIHMSFCRQCIMKRIISWSLPYPLWFLWQSAIQKYFKTRDNLSQTRHMSSWALSRTLVVFAGIYIQGQHLDPALPHEDPFSLLPTILWDLFRTTKIQAIAVLTKKTSRYKLHFAIYFFFRGLYTMLLKW